MTKVIVELPAEELATAKVLLGTDTDAATVLAVWQRASTAERELEALRAENRRLRLEEGRAEALRRIGSEQQGNGRIFSREELAEAWGIRG